MEPLIEKIAMAIIKLYDGKIEPRNDVVTGLL